MRVSTTALVALACTATSATAGAAQALTELTPFAAAQTERLLRVRYACLGCHRLGDEGGQIGPTLDGVGTRLTADRVLAMILDPARALPGTRMPRQPLHERDARRLAAFLMSRDPAPTAQAGGVVPAPIPPAPTLGAAPPDAAALYARHCTDCHGESGRGDGWNAPNLPVAPTAHADPALMSLRPDDTLFDAIYAGGYVLDGSPRMPAFGALLAPDEIRALVGHIRVLCLCEGPPWSGDRGAAR
jgi:mono/diheme cytochrome c family protein